MLCHSKTEMLISIYIMDLIKVLDLVLPCQSILQEYCSRGKQTADCICLFFQEQKTHSGVV